MSSNLAQTGIAGLDALLGGGIPTGRVVVVLGEPGAGKTTLCSHFLANGYSMYNENGVYVSLEESREHLFREMKRFGINFEQAEKELRFSFVDASPIRHVPDIVKVGNMTIGKKDFSLVSLTDGIRRSIATVNAKRVVIDPMSYLIFQYPEAAELRGALLDLVSALTETKATVLLSSELQKAGSVAKREIQMEEYVGHGTIIMQSIPVGKSMVRTIQVAKMRECEIDRQPRPYRISREGIEVYPKETVF